MTSSKNRVIQEKKWSVKEGEIGSRGIAVGWSSVSTGYNPRILLLLLIITHGM